MFNRTLFHVDEFGLQGINYLPAVLCLNTTVTLWSPAPLLLDQAKGIIGTKELLELVERRNVVIIGRHNWFDRSWRNRGNAWEFAKWQDGFDDRIMALANEDQREPILNRRVIIAPDEQGFEFAEAQLAQRPDIFAKLAELYNQKLLPAGILEKADRAKRQRKSVEIQILRDAYNHQQAIRDASADAATVPDAFMDTLLAVIDDLQPVSNSALPRVPADPVDYREALNLLRGIEAPTSYKSLITFLSSGSRNDLISLLCSERAVGTLPDSVASQIVAAAKIKETFDRLFPSYDPVECVKSLATAISILLSLLCSSPALSLVTLPFQIAKSSLQKRSLVPLEIDEKFKVRPLFQLALDKNRPTKKQVDTLISKLRSQ
jgi:hypothetical protein